MIQYRVIYRNSGCDKLRYASLHKFLGELGILKLLAYRHTLSGPYKFGKIGIKGMVRESGKLDILRHTVGTTRQRYAEYLGSHYGIIGKCFIKVTDTKQQYGIGMLLLHLDVLLHQRSFYYFCGHVLRGINCEGMTPLSRPPFISYNALT